MDVASIAPGETVVFVIGTAANVSTFHTVWDPVKSGFQVGWTNGASIGANSVTGIDDQINIWLGDPLTTGTIIESETYGMTTGHSGQSWDVVLEEFSMAGNNSGAVATLALGGTLGDEPALGSPGMVAIVPEPSSLILALSAGLCLAAAARRRRCS